MGPQSDIEHVRTLYRLFENRDLEACLAAFHPQIVVEQSPELPWGGRHEGRDGLGEFLLKLAGTIDSSLTIEQLYSAGDKVVQTGRTAGTVLATGAEFDIPEVHILTMSDGLVIRFEAFIDTPTMLATLADGG